MQPGHTYAPGAKNDLVFLVVHGRCVAFQRGRRCARNLRGIEKPPLYRISYPGSRSWASRPRTQSDKVLFIGPKSDSNSERDLINTVAAGISCDVDPFYLSRAGVSSGTGNLPWKNLLL